MNSLIETFFGDQYITLQCQGGECLHYSQVPGYVVSSCEPCTVSALTAYRSLRRNPTARASSP